MIEDIQHILTFCTVYTYSDVRTRILQEYAYLCLESKSPVNFEEIVIDSQELCQFILDPTVGLYIALVPEIIMIWMIEMLSIGINKW